MTWENKKGPATPGGGGGSDGYPLGAPEPEPEAAIAALREETPKEHKAKATALKNARQRAEKAAKAGLKEATKAHKVRPHTAAHTRPLGHRAASERRCVRLQHALKVHTQMETGALKTGGQTDWHFSEVPEAPSDDVSTYMPPEEAAELKALGCEPPTAIPSTAWMTRVFSERLIVGVQGRWARAASGRRRP